MPPQKKVDAGRFRSEKMITEVGVEGVNRYPHRPTCLETNGSTFLDPGEEELYRTVVNRSSDRNGRKPVS